MTAAAGPAAAATAAASADLLASIARDAQDAVGATQATALATRLRRLAEQDSNALRDARAALTTAGEGGDARRDFNLGRTLDQTVALLLDIAEASADVATLARELQPHLAADDMPDAEAAALLALGAAQAVAHLLEVNLVVQPGDERLARARAAAGMA